MIINRTPESLDIPIPVNLDKGTYVTIGNFDGVHLGHKALLERTKANAIKNDAIAVAVTFDPHPLEVLTPHAPPRLCTTATRLALLEAMGMDIVLLLSFTPELAAMSPEAFVRRLLLNTLHMRGLFLGHDFSLGRNRSGTPERLMEIGIKEGFTVDKMSAFTVDDIVVSSTRIRQILRDGQPWLAESMLGRPHAVRGEIIHGQERGRLLGFSTANLAPGEVMLPKAGVYATFASLPYTTSPLPILTGLPIVEQSSQTRKKKILKPLEKKTWRAVTNVGHNPTFGPNALSVETHLLDFSGDIYGQQLEVAFVERLRDEITFTGPEALVAQIAKDIKSAEKLFATLS